jgi:hypothetical protein
VRLRRSAMTNAARAGAVLLASAALVAGCGGSDSPETLIGEWELERDCPKIVQGLEEAGLEEFTLEVIATAEMVPGVVNDPTQFEDPKNPCKGATPTKHSHFFTAEGQFGSRNEFGEQATQSPSKTWTMTPSSLAATLPSTTKSTATPS